MFPRLQRFDVDFDPPEPFLPEFPPAIFLQNRPELGDVSRGEVVSINNFYRLFKDLITPVQSDGLRNEEGKQERGLESGIFGKFREVFAIATVLATECLLESGIFGHFRAFGGFGSGE
jgi:hypothetical protein